MREGTQAQKGVRGLLGFDRIGSGKDEGQVGDGKRVDRVSWLVSLVILFQMSGPSTIEQFPPVLNLKESSHLLEALTVPSSVDQTSMYGKRRG